MPKQNKRGAALPSSKKKSQFFDVFNRDAAGIDIGSDSHFVAVPADRDEQPVREFKSFTSDLYALADWLESCRIKTVAMESTGVYWIPLYTILEERGYEVFLVNARHVKNVSGRKSDVSDCQWLQQLHTYGLLQGSFRPTEQICELRSYCRHRHGLVEQASMYILLMQKALDQMNLKLHNVISDITGKTGLLILRAIISGERDPAQLARFRDHRCRNTREMIESSLTGHYREEHVFELKQSLELYDFCREKMRECDLAIEKTLQRFEDVVSEASTLSSSEPLKKKKNQKRSKNAVEFAVEPHLKRITGVDLTLVPGFNAHSALKWIAEVGLDMTRWQNAKQFVSWLGVCPNNKVSGGKRLRGRSKPSSNKAAGILRMAASTLYKSASALGAFLRRKKAQLGPPKAITATAHKLAKILYHMLRYGTEYQEAGQTYYEEQYRSRLIKGLRKKASLLGFELTEKQLEINSEILVI